MARPVTSKEYDRICLSLQSPLPNEQDMGISVCTLLSNETKHALKLNKAPGVLELLVAHAGIYNHCGMRELMDETYQNGRGYSFDVFWKDMVPSPDIRELLCECFYERFQHSVGLTEEMIEIVRSNPELDSVVEVVKEIDKSETKPDLGSKNLESDAEVPKETQTLEPNLEADKEAKVPEVDVEVDMHGKVPEVDVETEKETIVPEVGVETAKETKVLEIEVGLEKETIVLEVDSEASKETKIPEVDIEVAKETIVPGVEIEVAKETLVLEVDDEVAMETEVPEINPEAAKVSQIDIEAAREAIVSEIDVKAGKETIVPEVDVEPVTEAIVHEVDVEAAKEAIVPEVDTEAAKVTKVPDIDMETEKETAVLEVDVEVEKETIVAEVNIEQEAGIKVNETYVEAEKEKMVPEIDVETEKEEIDYEVDLQMDTNYSFCCERCPCKGRSTVFDSPKEEENVILNKLSKNADKIGQRVTQIASIFRNLSFDKVNAEVMSHSTAIMRFIVITANSTFGSLPQHSMDILGNIAKYMDLEDPMDNPFYSMIISLVVDGLFSVDRFRILRSLETLREWTNRESNEIALGKVLNHKLMERICELLTISDIMMLIYSLECILSLTTMNAERMCNELADVPGSVDTLVSLVTVEAQSYGPKGCIHMRVVETVFGQQALMAAAAQAQQASGIPPSVPMHSMSGPVMMNPMPLPPVKVGMSSPLSSGTFMPTTLSSAFASSIPIPGNNEKSTESAFGPSSSLTSFPPLPAAPSSPSYATVYVPQPPVSPPASFSPTMKGPSATKVTVSTTSRSSSRDSPITVTTTSSTTSSPCTSSGYESYANSPVPPKSETSNHPPLHTQQAQSLPIAQPQPQVYSPSISLVTPEGTLSEDGWAVAWIKGAFEQVLGTSIEQGEIYRMYCSARKNPNVVLSVDQFIHCVKCTYGAGIGPVIKNFGGGPLFFLDGIRPKMTSCGVIASNPPVVPIVTSQSGFATPLATTSPVLSSDSSSQTTSEAPLSVNIPSRENKTTLSPILKATLSRPPKPKNSTGSKKQKGTSRGASKSKRLGGGEVHKGTSSVLNPTSSAIRSLLASKVAQRQQKKQQQTDSKKTSLKGGKDGKKGGAKARTNSVTFIKEDANVPNGIDGTSESSASSSLQSSESAESPIPPPLISFQGVLRNGINSESSKDDETHVDDDLSMQFKGSKFKGMLVDLLERKVNSRENVNGMVGNRDIRISEARGLELVDKIETDANNSNSSTASFTSVSFLPNHHTSGSSNNMFNSLASSDPNDSQSSQQQMTFYSATDSQVTFQGQVSNSNGSSKGPTSAETDKLNCFSDLVLLSGGGNGVNATGGGDSSCSNSSKDMVDINMDDTDLLEKFNEISDLIVVPPEQFGLKRSHSISEDSAHLGPVTEEDKPPFKKPCTTHMPNGNGCISPSPSQPPETATSVLHTALNKPAMTAPVPTLLNHVTKAEEQDPIQPPVSNSPVRVIVSTQSVNCASISSIVQSGTSQPAGTPSSMVQLPLRIAVNSTPGQYTFARLPSGQQILLQSTNNTQTNLQGAQVLISKPPSSSNDQMAKAIIILQPQPGPVPSGLMKLPSTQATVPASSTPTSTASASAKSSVTASSSSKPIPASSPMTTRHKALFSKQKSQELMDIEFPYLCEWGSCTLRFSSHQQALLHVLHTHAPESLTEAIRCDWGGNGCDSVPRKRYSLMTHLQDRHCSKPAMDLALYRRKNKIDPPPPPQTPINHSGYAPNAAFHAIKRHALQFMNPKELTDDNEGPVTKSIRLTSALILKNLCNYSSLGRKLLKGHESHLASIAMSSVESSRTIAQLLYDMNELGS